MFVLGRRRDRGRSGHHDRPQVRRHHDHRDATRIVAADTQWLDALLELGIQPVGYLAAGPMGDERGLFPWESGVDASAKELDRSAIQQFGVPLKAEEIAALDPDLILGGFSVADQDDFDQLSKIAPTIAGLSDVQVDPWQDQVEILGRVLDKESRADEIVEATNGRSMRSHSGCRG